MKDPYAPSTRDIHMHEGLFPRALLHAVNDYGLTGMPFLPIRLSAELLYPTLEREFAVGMQDTRAYELPRNKRTATSLRLPAWRESGHPASANPKSKQQVRRRKSGPVVGRA